MPLANRKLNPEAEQLYKVINGQVPDWVPRYGLIGPSNPYSTTPANERGLWSTVLPPRTATEDGKFVDYWGVTYVPEHTISDAALPEPDNFILDDIANWPDIIKAPDLSNVDWEIACKKDLEAAGDISEFVVSMGGGGGFFLPLMNFMGFTNGLIAMYEEPDLVHELFTYLADFYCSMLDQQWKYWGDIIDMGGIGDDAATAANPFISPLMFREMVKPYHARLTKYAQERGLPVNMHCCGRCEDFIPDWVDYGVSVWNPAQVDNDLDGIKAKYGRSLALAGCWDSSGPAGWPDAPEELVREAVRETINRFGKDGGFLFYGSSYGTPGEEGAENKKRWITQAYEEFRAEPYK
ncbi:MAG: veratrol--corrinoid protein metyltransferase [Coriobacteriia bacterium]|nr:veratrol--corrinoid protein metyltransferase [Coriobacteriia bacterium]